MNFDKNGNRIRRNDSAFYLARMRRNATINRISQNTKIIPIGDFSSIKGISDFEKMSRILKSWRLNPNKDEVSNLLELIYQYHQDKDRKQFDEDSMKILRIIKAREL